MIASLRGVVSLKNKHSLVVEVAGIGYEVMMTQKMIAEAKIGKEIFLHCYHYIREGSLDLYGFIASETLVMFKMLISVSGIGPRSALSILDIATISEISAAISSSEPKILTRVSGVGSKLAGRIILELKNKMMTVGDEVMMVADLDAVDGLVQLGYSKSQAKTALELVPSETRDAGQRLKEALKILGKK